MQWLILSKLNLLPNQLLAAAKLVATLISILFTTNISMCLADSKRLSGSSLLAENLSTLLTFIGTSSMIIYLTHVLTGSGTRIVLQHFLGVSNFYVHLILGCIAGIFGSIFLAKMLSKIGFSFLFKIPDWLSVERKHAKLLDQSNSL